MNGDDARGVVLSGTGGIWQVRTTSGDIVDSALRGRLKVRARPNQASATDPIKLAVGDDVRVERGDGSGWAIAEIYPRRSKLARRTPGGGPGERVLAANIDQVVVVFAAAKPEPHLRMLDRFLVIAEANALAARIVVNKVELVGAGTAQDQFADYSRAGYETHFTSVKRGDGLDALRSCLATKISVLTGPSGVGKSSMLNALFPGLNLRVGEISESVNKGRHTTVGALMVPLPDVRGGYVVDTPGLREVGLSELPSERLDVCFPEFRPLLAECRFGDCRHVSEPECGVQHGLETGDVSRARYESYRSLLDELEGRAQPW